MHLKSTDGFPYLLGVDKSLAGQPPFYVYVALHQLNHDYTGPTVPPMFPTLRKSQLSCLARCRPGWLHSSVHDICEAMGNTSMDGLYPRHLGRRAIGLYV